MSEQTKPKMHFSISPDGTQVLSFRKEADARAEVAKIEGSFYATDLPQSLEELPLALLVSLHNIVRPEKPVKSFKDRATAVKRMDKVLETLATPGSPSQVAGSITPADGTAPATDGQSAATPATPRAKKDPAGKLAGHTIIRRTRTNPRKPGTSGHRSHALLTEGMTVEDFIKAGGVRRDLEWDVEHKWTALVPTAEYKAGMEEEARVAYEAEQAAAAAAKAASTPPATPVAAPEAPAATGSAAPAADASSTPPAAPEAATA